MKFRRLKRFLTLGLGAAALGRPAPAAGQEGAWRPRTIPLVGASYAPDLGLVVGVGVVHTRYAFRALPPSTRLLAEAEYGSAAGSYRAELAGEFRRPLAPTVLTVELRASGLRSEEHTSELQSRLHLVCRLLLEKKKCTTEPHTVTY